MSICFITSFPSKRVTSFRASVQVLEQAKLFSDSRSFLEIQRDLSSILETLEQILRALESRIQSLD